MWITQSYLGNPEPEASIYIYYLFEDYNSVQEQFTKAVQSGLEDLGELFKNRVSLFMPSPRFAVSIESEVRESVEPLWWSLQGKLPGLLFSTRPLSKFNGKSGEYHYLDLSSCKPEDAVKAISKIRQLTYNQLSCEHSNKKPESKAGLLKRILGATEFKLGIGPVKIDLKKLCHR